MKRLPLRRMCGSCYTKGPITTCWVVGSGGKVCSFDVRRNTVDDISPALP